MERQLVLKIQCLLYHHAWQLCCCCSLNITHRILDSLISFIISKEFGCAYNTYNVWFHTKVWGIKPTLHASQHLPEWGREKGTTSPHSLQDTPVQGGEIPPISSYLHRHFHSFTKRQNQHQRVWVCLASCTSDLQFHTLDCLGNLSKWEGTGYIFRFQTAGWDLVSREALQIKVISTQISHAHKISASRVMSQIIKDWASRNRHLGHHETVTDAHS